MAGPDEGESHAKNAGLYATMIAYLLSLFAVGVVAHRRSKRATGGELGSHFSGSFNAGLLVLTTFSSLFSGYTVTGVPQEASQSGFLAIRWIPSVGIIAIGMLTVYPRLRRLAETRGYLSPNDFIADRFRSSTLRLLTAFCMCVPQVLYLAVQVKSFASLLRTYTLGVISEPMGMALFAVVVLGMEVAGGVHSVVLTDAVQAVIMIMGFMVLPFLLASHYGTLGHLAPADCPSLFYVNRTSADYLEWSGALNVAPATCSGAGAASEPACAPVGCIKPASPAFYKYPKKSQLSSYFFFLFNMLSFPLNPHMVQRVYMAANDRALWVVCLVMCVAAYVAFPPGIMTGIIKATFEDGWPASQRRGTAFAAIGLELTKIGGFVEDSVVALLTCAVLAAIMSTSDSLILGVSNTLAVDLFKGWLMPDIRDSSLKQVGFAISTTAVVLGCIAGSFLTTARFGHMMTLQNGILLQVVPAYLVGLFSSVSAVALIAGISVGLLTFAAAFVVEQGEAMLIPSGNLGFMANLTVLAFARVLLGGESAAPPEASGPLFSRFGGLLTQSQVEQAMAGVREPNRSVLAAALVLNFAGLPWDVSRGDGTVAITFAGFPSWAGINVVCFVASTLLQLTALATWQPTTQEAEASQADAATMELTSVQ